MVHRDNSNQGFNKLQKAPQQCEHEKREGVKGTAEQLIYCAGDHPVPLQIHLARQERPASHCIASSSDLHNILNVVGQV